jgi:hypothetical protein
VIGGEIEVVTFLGETARALAVHAEVHVVVEFPLVKEGGPGAGEGVRRHQVLDEEMHDRQRGLDGGIGHDRAR